MANDVFNIVGTTQAKAFHVESVVAEGGFGVIYRARHGGFRATVALKCLKVPETMNEAQRATFLERFREEGELLFRLSSLIPAVVRPLHVGTLDGVRFVPFLAMEWLEGEGLDEIVQKRAAEGKTPLRMHQLVKVLTPIAHALDKAHNFPGPHGLISVVHRDLKPENIFVVTNGGASETVKILDFGIARTRSAAASEAGRATEGDALASFTPAYAAPEQWAPKRFGQCGPWTDVYGLAITMVEALVGKPPVEGEAAAMMGTACDPDRRPTPRTEGATVPDAVESVFVRALAVDPRERVQSIQAFWSALETAIGVTPTIAPTIDSREAMIELTFGESAPRGSSAPPALAQPMPALELELDAPPPSRRVESASSSSARRVFSPPLERDLLEDDPPVRFEVAKGGGGSFSTAEVALDLPPRSRSRPPPSSTRGGGVPYVPVAPLGAQRTHRESVSLKQTLRAPLVVFFIGIGCAVVDVASVRSTNEAITVGPARLLHIGAVLALLGLVAATLRIIYRDDDD